MKRNDNNLKIFKTGNHFMYRILTCLFFGLLTFQTTIYAGKNKARGCKGEHKIYRKKEKKNKVKFNGDELYLFPSKAVLFEFSSLTNLNYLASLIPSGLAFENKPAAAKKLDSRTIVQKEPVVQRGDSDLLNLSSLKLFDRIHKNQPKLPIFSLLTNNEDDILSLCISTLSHFEALKNSQQPHFIPTNKLRVFDNVNISYDIKSKNFELVITNESLSLEQIKEILSFHESFPLKSIKISAVSTSYLNSVFSLIFASQIKLDKLIISFISADIVFFEKFLQAAESGYFSHLKSLSLANVSLFPQHFEFILKALKSNEFPHLSQLLLMSNAETEEQMNVMLNLLVDRRKFPSLSTIQLMDNNLSAKQKDYLKMLDHEKRLILKVESKN